MHAISFLIPFLIGAFYALIVVRMVEPIEQFRSIAKWQNKTFRDGTPAGSIAHLRRELDEVEESVRLGLRAGVTAELADVFILWVGVCARLGLGRCEMGRAIAAKMKKNRRRRWGKADADGVIEHIRGLHD